MKKFTFLFFVFLTVNQIIAVNVFTPFNDSKIIYSGRVDSTPNNGVGIY